MGYIVDVVVPFAGRLASDRGRKLSAPSVGMVLRLGQKEVLNWDRDVFSVRTTTTTAFPPLPSLHPTAAPTTLGRQKPQRRRYLARRRNRGHPNRESIRQLMRLAFSFSNLVPETDHKAIMGRAGPGYVCVT